MALKIRFQKMPHRTKKRAPDISCNPQPPYRYPCTLGFERTQTSLLKNFKAGDFSITLGWKELPFKFEFVSIKHAIFFGNLSVQCDLGGWQEYESQRWCNFCLSRTCKSIHPWCIHSVQILTSDSLSLSDPKLHKLWLDDSFTGIYKRKERWFFSPNPLIIIIKYASNIKH